MDKFPCSIFSLDVLIIFLIILGCGTTVHQNTCKDNIQDCVKKGVKVLNQKNVSHKHINCIRFQNTSKLSSFSVPLAAAKNFSSKRGSASYPSSQSNTSR